MADRAGAALADDDLRADHPAAAGPVRHRDRHGRDIPLARINDVSFEKGLLDRLLGSGGLVVESAGEHGQILLNDIPRVEFTQATLFRLVEEEQRRLERNERSQP